MICTGNCVQGRRCTCAPTPAYHMRDWLVLKRWKRERDIKRENLLALVFLALLMMAVAAGWV